MSNTLKFSLYSVLKNEDAPPFVGKNLLVAADGLGGAGSTVHEIDRKRHSRLAEDIRRAAFGDFDLNACEEGQFASYLDQLIEPMSDGVADTSALWGSRIAIGRFLYAVRYLEEFSEIKRLRDPDVRERLAAFVSKGLHRVVKEFDLKRGKYDNQLLLPTTLAAVFFEERESTVVADCIWAGDSRCYALLPSGMKLLTEDDEDSSGAITNLFFASDKPTVLHHRRYQFSKPCALLAVSDGVFDPYDPHDYLGVEHTVQCAIAENESLEELRESLLQTFNSIHSDDATIAFTAFGFCDYADMKQSLAGRCQQVESLLKRWKEMHSVLEVINQPEEDIAGYIRTRTSDKYAAIAAALIPMLIEKKRDVVLRGAISERVELLRHEAVQRAEQERQAQLEEIFEKIYKVLLADPQNASQYLTRNHISFSNANAVKKRLETNFRRAVAAAREIATHQKALDDKIKARRSHLEQEARLREQITDRIGVYTDRLDRFKNEPIVNASKKQRNDADRSWVELINLITMWQLIEFDFLHGTVIAIPDKKQTNLPNQRSAALMKAFLTKAEDRAFVRRLIAYQTKIKELDSDILTSKSNVKGATERYLKAIDGCFPILLTRMIKPEMLFQPKFAERMGLPLPKATAADLADHEMENALKSLFLAEREWMGGQIVAALAAAPQQSSVIDGYYNNTRLTRFRTYYHCKTSSLDNVRRVERDLERMREAHESLLKSDAT